ncbi:MAG: hypothetical protein ABIH42_10335 [Planctomycetota bacterium]
MAFTDAGIPYVTKRDAIISLFQANMSTLNNNMVSNTFTSNEQIIGGDPRITPTPVGLYPMITVSMTRKEEAFDMLGAAERRKPWLNYKIFGITRDMRAGKFQDEIMYLAENIEQVIRENITISSNFLWVEPYDTEWGYDDSQEDSFVDIVVISLRGKVEVK